MALQGTLDTFSLPDVLRLLATTGKTGCLHVEGDRGRGSVWLDSGAVVAATAERALDAAPIDEVIFEMLRFGRGSFSFAIDERAPDDNQQPKEIESTLRRSTQLLDEWRDLESVVPSLSHRVALAPELTVDQVTIDAPRWQALVAIASGRSVGELAESLRLGELAVSRTVSDLVELGVAMVEPPGAARAPAASSRRTVNDSVPRSKGGESPRRAAMTPSLEAARSDARRESREPREPATAASSMADNSLSGWMDDTKTPVETAPKPRSAKTSTTRPPRTRRTGPTPTTTAPGPAPVTSPARNGNGQPLTGSLVPPPVVPPAPMAPPLATPALPPPVDRARPSSLPQRGPFATNDGPGPFGSNDRPGPLLPASLDTGRLGPSPLPQDTGQIPAVAASALPPDLSWAAEDHDMRPADPFVNQAPPPLTPLAPPTTPLPATLRTSPPGRLLAAPQGRVATNGRHEGDPAQHVEAMSPEARAAVEATIGRAGGGSGGMPMAGATQDQMLSRSQLLQFLSSVRQ